MSQLRDRLPTKAVIGWVMDDNYKTPLIEAAIEVAARYQKLADDAIFLFEGSEADEIAHGSLEASAPVADEVAVGSASAHQPAADRRAAIASRA